MKYPFYRQYDSMDCGPACLRMIAKYYGKSFSAAYLKKLSNQKKSGTSLLDLSSAAETIGFRTTGVKITWEQFSNQLSFPCVVTWNKTHFIVVYKIKKNKIIIGDPAQGILQYPVETFKTCWLSIDEVEPMGVALLFEPTPLFYKSSEDVRYIRRISFTKLLKYIKPYIKYLWLICALILLSSLLSFVFPALTKANVDIGINNNNISFVKLVLLAQFFLIIGQASNEMLKNWLLLNVSIRVNLSLVSDFLGKLMRLPIAFFDSKRIGDLIQRIGDFTRIQQFLTSVLISLIMAIVGFFAYGIVMYYYNLQVLIVFIIGSIVYVSWIFIFLNKRKKLDYMRFQESASNQSNIIQLITGMQEIKLNNCEQKKQWEWEQIQTRLYDISLKSLNLYQLQHVGGLFVDQAKNILISYLTAKSVISGDMTLGMMLALQYVVGQMNAPVSQFISFVESAQDAKISLDRLNEIHEIPDEDEQSKSITYIKDSLPIYINNLYFSYGQKSKLALQNINLEIEAKKITAIVGASGSGKSTLLKMLLGFYEPTKGNIMIGDIDLQRINNKAWRDKCGVVMQDGFIFSDTISNNIAASDSVANMQKVVSAAKKSNIDTFISQLPMKYNTIIGMEGNNMSAGQKQRILVARAMYKDAPFLFLDEATNALDANNESEIMSNILQFCKDKTVVIIAHRLSTISHADKIVVMDAGRIVESGNHSSLLAKQGYYYQLINKQLNITE